MARTGLLAIVVALLATCADVRAAAPCAASVAALRELVADPGFALRWRETSMDDGKPLILTIHERGGALALEFVKSGQGLWAESEFLVCRRGGDLEARAVSSQVRVGSAAGWLTRIALSNGGTFTLHRIAPERLRIATGGWSGIFMREPLP